MRRAALLALACALTVVPARATDAPPHVEGPDVPPATAPARRVVAFDGERFECAEEVRTRAIRVPRGAWDRIVLVFSSEPDGDPWDRLFGVAIEGVEVLRGTTPRTLFTIRRDVTEYAALLRPGALARISLRIGSYVGALEGSVTLEFHAGEPTAALVAPPVDEPVPAFAWRVLGGDGARERARVRFPRSAPSSATVEITLSGHGPEEFWYESSPVPRAFHVLVGGREVAVARAMPYVYALLGFGNSNANTPCVGPGTSSTGDRLHPVLWWSAHQALDVAGIHTGNGEIPSYRAEVAAADLALLRASRTVDVVQEGGEGNWVTSVSFLLD